MQEQRQLSFPRALRFAGILLCLPQNVYSFITTKGSRTFVASPQLTVGRNVQSSCPSRLMMGGGFGGSASSKKGDKKSKLSKSSKGGASPIAALKPKAQWDRFILLKKNKKIPVAVRKRGAEEWFEVGSVRSENDEMTGIAVASQRALIAEHGKRIYPNKISTNDVLEWGHRDGSGSEYVVLSSDTMAAAALQDVHRKIGFEGIADPRTGYYCHYSNGRLVDRESDGGKSYSKLEGFRDENTNNNSKTSK